METIKQVTITLSQLGFSAVTTMAIPAYLMGVAHFSVSRALVAPAVIQGFQDVQSESAGVSMASVNGNEVRDASPIETLEKKTGPLSLAKDLGLAKKQAKELLSKQFRKSAIARTLHKAQEIGMSESAYSQFIGRYLASKLPKPFVNIAPLIAQAIETESEKRGLDPFLLMAVIQTESSFRPQIRGSAGEIGLMQLMPATAEWLAKKNGIDFLGEASLRNPVENVRLGAIYLSHLRARFDANGHLYMTAYNMGSTKLKRKIASMTEEEKLPEIYAKKILKNYENLYREFDQKAVATFAAAKRPMFIAYQ